jgi:hypothetical protein
MNIKLYIFIFIKYYEILFFSVRFMVYTNYISFNRPTLCTSHKDNNVYPVIYFLS